MATVQAISLRSVCSDVRGTTYATHCIHPFYPARFIPQVPRYVLEHYPVDRRPAVVLDPFAGAGTTAVEAYLLGHHSWTVDVNPLTAFLVRVKLTPVPERTLPAVWHACLDHIARMRFGRDDFTPVWKDLTYWFPEEVLPPLRRMWGYLHRLGDSVEARILRAAALAVTRHFSWGDSTVPKLFKSKRRKTELPRILDELARNPDLPFVLLKETVRRYVHGAVGLDRLARGARVEVTGMPSSLPSDGLWALTQTLDARQIGPVLREAEHKVGAIDYIITSPPYCYAQEYFRSTKIDLYWLGLADDMTLRRWVKCEIGYTTAEPAVIGDLRRRLPSLDRFLGLVEQDVGSGRRSNLRILQGYFADLWRVLEQVVPFLRPGGWCAVFVGEPRVLGHIAPLHTIIAECLEALGLEVYDLLYDVIRARNLFRGRRNRNPEGLTGEWLVIARRSERPR